MQYPTHPQLLVKIVSAPFILNVGLLLLLFIPILVLLHVPEEMPVFILHLDFHPTQMRVACL